MSVSIIIIQVHVHIDNILQDNLYRILWPKLYYENNKYFYSLIVA